MKPWLDSMENVVVMMRDETLSMNLAALSLSLEHAVQEEDEKGKKDGEME